MRSGTIASLALLLALAGAGCKKDGGGRPGGTPGQPGGAGGATAAGALAGESGAGGAAATEYDLPFDETDPEEVAKEIARLADRAQTCADAELTACVAMATGDPTVCDETLLKEEEQDLALLCRAWAGIRKGVRGEAACDDVEPKELGTACRILSRAATLECAQLEQMEIPARFRAGAVQICRQVWDTEKPRCPEGDEGEEGAEGRGGCEIFLIARALKERRPELCEGAGTPGCRAFVTGDPGACFQGAPKGLDTAAAVRRLRADCRPFVLGQAENERTEGETGQVAALALGRNLFDREAEVRAEVTIRKDDTVVETFTRDVGTLEDSEELQRFEFTFQKPAGTRHEVRWVADWE